MKRTAMKRASFESVRAWKARSKPMRRRSVKMAAEYVKRRAFVAQFLADHDHCEFRRVVERFDGPPRVVREVMCSRLSVDVHEVIRRSHGAAIYPGQEGKRPTEYRALCRQHHDYITTHPAWAQENGWEVK